MTSGLFRLRSVGADGRCAALGLIGFTALGFGAALVGETRRTETAPKATAAIEAMKAEYKPPRDHPVPEGKSLHAGKGGARQEALFRYAALGPPIAQSCASPVTARAIGWGDGLAVGVGHGMKPARAATRPRSSTPLWGAIFMWDGRAGKCSRSRRSVRSRPTCEMNMPLDKLHGAPRRRSSEYKPLFEGILPRQCGIEARHDRQGHRDLRTDRGFRTALRSTTGSRATRRRFPKSAKRGFVLFNTKARMLVLP